MNRIEFRDNIPVDIRNKVNAYFHSKAFFDYFNDSGIAINNDLNFYDELLQNGYKIHNRVFGYEVVTVEDWLKEDSKEYPEYKQMYIDYLKRHGVSLEKINELEKMWVKELIALKMIV